MTTGLSTQPFTDIGAVDMEPVPRTCQPQSGRPPIMGDEQTIQRSQRDESHHHIEICSGNHGERKGGLSVATHTKLLHI